MEFAQLEHWSGLELRHLAALAAVADEGSFSAAAARLGYVQSAISRQIVFLERIVGIRLLDRSRGHSRVSLTPAGEVLLGHVQEIVGRLGAARADLAALDDDRAGVQRLGLAPGLEAWFVPDLLLRLVGFGSLRLDVRHAAADHALVAMLARDELDLAVVSSAPADGTFASLFLLGDPYVLLARAGSPLAHLAAGPTVRDLQEAPLIGRRAATDTRSAMDELGAMGVRPDIVFASDDDATVHALVGSGVGLAIVPALSVDWYDRATVALPLDGILRPRTIWLTWHAQRRRAPAVEGVGQALTAIAAAIERDLAARMDTPPPRLAAVAAQ